MISKLFAQLMKRKFLALILFLVIAGASYLVYGKIFSKDGATRYVVAEVQKGTLIASIAGSGQVTSSNQVEIKSKVSGDAARIAVKSGEAVKAGALIVQLDARDAQKAVRDAEVSLESAKLALEKLKKPSDELSLLQSENALAQAKRELDDLQKPPDNLSLLQAENDLAQAKDNMTKLKLSQEIAYQKTLESSKKANDDLKKAYEDGFNVVSNAFLDLPGVMAGLNDMFFGEGIAYHVNQVSLNNRDKAVRYRDDVYAAYDKSRAAYTKSFDNYKAASRTSDTKTIEALIAETYETAKLIADTVKTANNYIDFVQDDMEQRDLTIPALGLTQQSKIDSYTKTTNTDLLSLLSVKNAIQTSKETILNSDRASKEMEQNHPIELSAALQTIREKEEALAKVKAGPEDDAIQTAKEKVREKERAFAKLKAGADALDIKSAELTVKQRQNALFDAQEKLADYFVRAPFDGVIAKISIKQDEAVSSSMVIATLITEQKTAEASLNEVDVAKVKVGQKAAFTFDAIEDLTITGQVAEVDALGAVSQGVVTYTVKIIFDTQDERVKTGMSVSAAIVTESTPDVLLAPNSAVKSQGRVNYVEVVGEDEKDAALSANANGAILKNPPSRRRVEIGSANDEFTEVINGLSEGDVIVTRTIQPNSAKTTGNQQNSAIRIPGLQGGGQRGGGFGR